LQPVGVHRRAPYAISFDHAEVGRIEASAIAAVPIETTDRPEGGMTDRAVRL